MVELKSVGNVVSLLSLGVMKDPSRWFIVWKV